MTDLKIGNPVWFFDVKRRVYAYNADGQAFGPPIWRERWRKFEVIGETSRSWLIGFSQKDSRPVKLPKVGEWSSEWAVSEAEINEREWVETHRISIFRIVQDCRDATTLRKIADLIGYKEAK